MAVILTLDPATDMEKALAGLRAARFSVGTVLETLHVVSGQGDAAALKAVRKLPYVKSVEADAIVRLTPGETPDMGRGWPGNAETGAAPRVTGASWRSPAWDAENG
jgi:hypothetical protein